MEEIYYFYNKCFFLVSLPLQHENTIDRHRVINFISDVTEQRNGSFFFPMFIENFSVKSSDININKSTESIRKDIFSVPIRLYKITYIVLSKPSVCKGSWSD